MAERRAIRLADDDMIAAAQILALIAHPDQPAKAMRVLDHWRRELQRGWGRPDPMPAAQLMRRNRIEKQFRRLEAVCLDAFRAGVWLNHEILTRSTSPWFASFDKRPWGLATSRANSLATGALPQNEFARIWSRRKPVAHMALAAGNEIGWQLAQHDLEGFGLSWSILNPAWVAEAIEQSEKWARSAQHTALPFVRFHRDTFL